MSEVVRFLSAYLLEVAYIMEQFDAPSIHPPHNPHHALEAGIVKGAGS